MYTDSVEGQVAQRLWDSAGLTDSLRIPPDGQESAALLNHVEEAAAEEEQGERELMDGPGHLIVGGDDCNGVLGTPGIR